jgi:hypothetical protein
MSELAFATKEAREINPSVLQGLVQLMTSGVLPPSIYTYISMDTCMHTYIHIYTCTHIYIYMYIYIYIYIYTYICVFVCVCVYVHMYDVYICKYM